MKNLLRVGIILATVMGIWGFKSEFTTPSFAQTISPVSSIKNLSKDDILEMQALKLFIEEKYDEALPLAQEILTIRRSKLGENHPKTGMALNNLGRVYHFLGRYDEAISSYKQALAIYEQKPKTNHDSILNTLSNLEEALSLQGNNKSVLRCSFLNTNKIVRWAMPTRH
ncbi:MAG: tetratricopeptide repeat protein [Crocosphaera sp.]|nr:tetratricopeptide repeat protein [Crocosphaera sp.]